MLSELAFGFEPVTYSLSMRLISKPCIYNSVGQQLIYEPAACLVNLHGFFLSVHGLLLCELALPESVS